MASDFPTERVIVIGLLVLAGLVLLPMILMSVAVPMMGSWGGGMMDGYSWSGGSAIWWGGMMIGWIVVLLVGGYFLLRGVSSPSRDPALKELRMAYARGDLSEEEFENRHETLEADTEGH